MTRPALEGRRIALSMRVTHAAGYDEPRDAISHDWVRWLSHHGAIPLPIPNLVPSPAAYLDGLSPDLLVLTGGDDWGETPERDTAERALFEHVLRTGMPIFGVCRGMQLINRFLGGALSVVSGHVGTNHHLTLAEPWQARYGEGMTVNSFHGQGISSDGLGADLSVFAYDRDHNVEGLCHRRLPVLGVMWHPERPGAPANDAGVMARLIAEGTFWA